MVLASVIVVTKNRPDYLKKCVLSLLKQSVKDLEIIIVGDGCTEETRSVANSFKSKKPIIRFFYKNGEGLPSGRNFGIMQASANKLLFIDDDEVADSKWAQNMLAAFGRGIIGVEGKIVTDNSKRVFYSAPENPVGGKYVGGNMAFLKSALVSVGLYDTRYFYGRDDSDIALRVLAKGKIVFAQDAFVYHPQMFRGTFWMLKSLFFLKFDFIFLKKFQYTAFKYVYKDWFRDLFGSVFLFLSVYLLFYFLPLFFLLQLVFIFRCRSFEFDAKNWFLFYLLSLMRGLFFPFFFGYYFLRYFVI
jgi:glycosyltransferase involved in cell wall biosynthesis